MDHENLKDYEFDVLYNYAASPVEVTKHEVVKEFKGVKYLHVKTYHNGIFKSEHYDCNLTCKKTEAEIKEWIAEVFGI